MTPILHPSAETASSPRNVLAVILASAFILRLVVFLIACHNSPELSALHNPDTHTYVAPAEALVHSGHFSRNDVTEVIRTPGYPMLLLPGVLLGHVEIVTVLLQILLSVATVALVYRLTWEWTTHHAAALVAAGLAAIEPLSVTYASILMPETLFSFLLVCTLLALVRYLRRDETPALLAAALLLAAATYVRPISYYLLACIPLLLAVRSLWPRSTQRVGKLVCAGAFLVVCCAPVAAWQVRNYLETGYHGFSAIAEWNLYFYQGASILAHEKAMSLESAQAEMGYFDGALFDHLHADLQPGDQAAKYTYMRQAANELIRTHAAAYAKIHLRGIALLLLNPGASDLMRLFDCYPEKTRRPRPIDLGVLGVLQTMKNEAPAVLYSNLGLVSTLGLILALAGCGIAVGLKRLDWSLTLLVATASYFVVVSGGPAGVARMRHPVMPILCVLSGLGVAAVVRWYRALHRTPEAGYLVAPLAPSLEA